jgi:hypothetical protein
MKYRYSGPTSGVTLLVGATPQEVMLFDGSEIELPEDHEYVRTLIARKHLTPIEAPTKPAKTKGGE